MLVRAATPLRDDSLKVVLLCIPFAASLFGTLGALAKGFDISTAEGLGAACGPLLLGLAVGGAPFIWAR